MLPASPGPGAPRPRRRHETPLCVARGPSRAGPQRHAWPARLQTEPPIGRQESARPPPYGRSRGAETRAPLRERTARNLIRRGTRRIAADRSVGHGAPYRRASRRKGARAVAPHHPYTFESSATKGPGTSRTPDTPALRPPRHSTPCTASCQTAHRSAHRRDRDRSSPDGSGTHRTPGFPAARIPRIAWARAPRAAGRPGDPSSRTGEPSASRSHGSIHPT